MSQDLLVRYMEAALPHFRQRAGLPQWLMPEIAEAGRELGDDHLMELAGCLGLGDSVKQCLTRSSDTDDVVPAACQEGTSRWQPIHQVAPMILGLLRARDKVIALKQQGPLSMDPASFLQGLAVISFAPFVPGGQRMLDGLAGILGVSPDEPAELIDRYVTALADGDEGSLAAIKRCITEDAAWGAWSKRLLEISEALPFIPRAIGIRPAPSAALIQVLATMVREVLNADDRGNRPG